VAYPQAIDWECSCLSYYHSAIRGPCGEQFKNAFACVNYTDREQKVIECQPFWNQYYACVRADKESSAKASSSDERSSPPSPSGAASTSTAAPTPSAS
jgi:mitochondrial intermembrane space import and assembly protein 40